MRTVGRVRASDGVCRSTHRSVGRTGVRPTQKSSPPASIRRVCRSSQPSRSSRQVTAALDAGSALLGVLRPSYRRLGHPPFSVPARRQEVDATPDKTTRVHPPGTVLTFQFSKGRTRRRGRALCGRSGCSRCPTHPVCGAKDEHRGLHAPCDAGPISSGSRTIPDGVRGRHQGVLSNTEPSRRPRRRSFSVPGSRGDNRSCPALPGLVPGEPTRGERPERRICSRSELSLPLICGGPDSVGHDVPCLVPVSSAESS
jgi:hypothetical protein